jgi:hypothetical protein
MTVSSETRWSFRSIRKGRREVGATVAGPVNPTPSFEMRTWCALRIRSLAMFSALTGLMLRAGEAGVSKHKAVLTGPAAQ